MAMGTRILAVEDDERIRMAVKMALEDEGWSVEEAASGEDAIDSFTRLPADVVLIDIMLPGIDGFELCRTLRKSSDVPIVMVTARADTHDVVAGATIGLACAYGIHYAHEKDNPAEVQVLPVPVPGGAEVAVLWKY